jgi:hypothetical protein
MVVLPPASTRFRIVDIDGAVAAVHVRQDRLDGRKTFRWEREDGTPGLGGRPVATLPLYGIWRLDHALPDTPVFVVEGEKASDALGRCGIVALGTVTGASGTPDSAALRVLANRNVRLWPDNDAVGGAHMERIAIRLRDIAASVSVVAWPEADEHDDAADYCAAGHGGADILALPTVSAHPGEIVPAEGNRRPVLAPFLSAATRFPRPAETDPPFLTARQFGLATPAEVSWIARPYVAAGAITAVDGKIKAAGKTTLVLHLCRAVLEGRTFLGQPTGRTPVVYLTEQPPSSLREALRRADLLERDDFALLLWSRVASRSWPDVARQAVTECIARGAGLLVVDTLGRFAGIAGDGENHAGAAEAAMAPLQVACSDGLGVIVVRHERKSGGDVGDSGRGSSAFGGAVDIVLAVRRPEGGSRPNVRVVHADALDLPAELTGFDRALVDAPCSGLGVLAARPDLRWRSQPLPGLQLDLLRAAAGRVRPGGVVLYSVCTLNADENEAVVDASGLRVVPFGDEWPAFRHPRRPEFLLTTPHRHGTSGFFVARLEV